jgi:hypothetical protein
MGDFFKPCPSRAKAGSFAKEIHVVTYQGRVEAVSYAENAEMQAPKIDVIVANPEGLINYFS